MAGTTVLAVGSGLPPILGVILIALSIGDVNIMLANLFVKRFFNRGKV